MIRLGVCTSIQYVREMADIGFDYLEVPMNAIAAMPEADFQRARERMLASGIVCEAMNGMLPETIRVVGDNVQAQQIHEYLDLAFDRAQQLGTKVVVFGSGRSRQVPKGFDFAQAWRQLANYLRLVERHARDNGLVVAIEPLRRAECNIVNYVSEGIALASLVNMPHIGVLGDTYHMAMGSEPVDTLEKAGGLLCHIHVANAIGRTFPKKGDGEDYERLLKLLTKCGYRGRVSVEARTDDLLADAETAFHVLDDIRRTL